MDEVGDVDLKQERPNPYGPPPANAYQRMPPTETVGSHSYPTHPGAPAMPPPPWNPTPSPYDEPGEHRPPPPDMGHQPAYAPPPPPPQTYPPPPPGSGRDGPGYGPDASYSRQGSTSATTRSPADLQHPQYHPVNGNPHEQPYYPAAGAPEYRPRHAYTAPPDQANGGHQPPLHVVTAHDMMPGQPPGHPQYGPPSAGAPVTPAGYYPYDAYNNPQRRKPVRAAQACDSCRQRKAKCDEGRPMCTHCKDNGLECKYREIPPQKSEKQVLALQAHLDALTEDVKALLENSKAQDRKINLLLDMQQSQLGQSPESSRMEQKAMRPSQRTAHSPKPAVSAPMYKREDSHPQPAVYPQSQQSQSFSSAAKADPQDDAVYEFALPPKHTTAAHNLLSWPLIKALIPKNIPMSYVMDTESERGLLRLYGCGEGEDRGDGHEGAPSPAGSSSSDGRRLDDETSSSSAHGVWGSGQFQAPLNSGQNHSREHVGGLGPNGGLMLDSEAVDRYFKSYMDNMHILHPFLEPRVLRSMVHTFKKKYSWDYRPTQPLTSTIGSKRKRDMTDSPTSMDEYAATVHGSRNHGRPTSAPMPPIEHSVANAIVLLVMALGKICAYKDPLPGAAVTSSVRTSTPHSTMYSDLPMPMSAPNSPFNNNNNPAGLNGVAPMTVSSPANPQGKNMDIIPGLAYFAKAADIIGELPGGMDVSHVQVNVLAGLYMGQLARIFPSHFYISNACKACIVLVESTAYKNKEMKAARRNLINFAFWTCLQLESDILAEVNLPPSGITGLEGKQREEMPTGITLDPTPEASHQGDILRFYSYQIQLRRTMNSIHSILYRKEKPTGSKPSLNLIEVLNENLDDWRRLLNDWDWNDDDHESEDINVARMRGKYYGAKYIIYRPALHYALSLSLPSTPHHYPSESPMGGPGQRSEFSSPALATNPATYAHSSRRPSEMGPPAKDVAAVEPEFLEASKKCIHAAIRSTTCFDKVPPRLITTNIFGTAHAQFGNMLVLSATYTSSHPDLSSLVDESTLRRLFERTIKILKDHDNISPVLAKDLKILQHVRNNVFSQSYPPGSAASSFSNR